MKCVLRGSPFHFVPMNAPMETSKPLNYTPPPKPVQNKSADSPLNRYKNAIKSRISESIDIPKKKPKRMQPFMMADKYSKPGEESDPEILPCPIPEESSETELVVLQLPQSMSEIEPEMLPKPAAELLIEQEVEVLPEPEPEVVSEPEPEVISEPEPDVISKREVLEISKMDSTQKSKPTANYGRHGRSYSLMDDEMDMSFITPKPPPELLIEPVVEVLPELEPEVVSEPEPELLTIPKTDVTPNSKPNANYGRHGRSYALMEDEMDVPFDFLAAPKPPPELLTEPEVEVLSKPEVLKEAEPDSGVILTEPKPEVIPESKVALALKPEMDAPFDFLAAPIQEPMKGSKPEVDPKVNLHLEKKPQVKNENHKSESISDIIAGHDSKPKALASILTESIGRVSNANRMRAKV